MKKILCIFFGIILIINLSACINKTPGSQSKPNNNLEHKENSTKKEQLIGRLIDYSSFRFEVAKRINFDDYNCESDTESNLKTYDYKRYEQTEVDTQVDCFTLTIDDIKFSMPITVNNFVDMGFDIIDDFGNSISDTVLYEQDNCGSFNVKSPKGNTFTIFTISKDEKFIFIKDQIVIQVSIYMIDSAIDENNFRDDIPSFKCFGNLTNDSLVDDIIATLGEPNNMRFKYAQPQGSYESSYASIYFNHHFSNENFRATTNIESEIVLNESAEKTDYITYFDYYIFPDSLINFR